MANWTVENLTEMWEESGSYKDIYYNLQYAQEDFIWWCLGYNLEIAAALSAVRNLSWIRGWDAARTLASFSQDVPRLDLIARCQEDLNDSESYTKA